MRLIDLGQIRAEKISRSRAWIYARIAAGDFPKPLSIPGSGKNLWDQDEVDRWLAEFVAKAKSNRNGIPLPTQRTIAASAARIAKTGAPASIAA